eukprot:g6291.t1
MTTVTLYNENNLPQSWIKFPASHFMAGWEWKDYNGRFFYKYTKNKHKTWYFQMENTSENEKILVKLVREQSLVRLECGCYRLIPLPRGQKVCNSSHCGNITNSNVPYCVLCKEFKRQISIQEEKIKNYFSENNSYQDLLRTLRRKLEQKEKKLNLVTANLKSYEEWTRRNELNEQLLKAERMNMQHEILSLKAKVKESEERNLEILDIVQGLKTNSVQSLASITSEFQGMIQSFTESSIESTNNILNASEINNNQNHKSMEELKALILKTLILNSSTKIQIDKEEYMRVLAITAKKSGLVIPLPLALCGVWRSEINAQLPMCSVWLMEKLQCPF